MRSRLLLQNQPKFNKVVAALAVLALIGVGVFVVFFSRAASYNTFLPVTATAKPADSLVDSMAVNVHMNYSNTPYRNTYAMRDLLVELGIRHVRSSTYENEISYDGGIKTLAAAGIKTVGVVPHQCDKYTLDQALAFVKSNMDAYEAIEGMNEYDTKGPSRCNDSNALETIRTHQRLLWKKVQADPELKKLPVIGPSSGRNPAGAVPTNIGDLSDAFTYGNMHSYPGGRPPAVNLTRLLNEFKPMTGSRPMWATETGYHNAVCVDNSHKPASEKAAGIYYPRLYLDYFSYDIKRTYGYELLDQERLGDACNSLEASFGLVRKDLSRKPAFLAIKNMTTLLKDQGSAFTPAKLSYTLHGADANTRQLLLQKRDGSYWLALWQDTKVWDELARTESNPANTPVKLEFGAQASAINTYMPNRGTAAVAKVANSRFIEFESSEEVTLVEIKGVNASTPAPPLPASQGLMATYYNNPDISNTDPSNTSITRIDPTVNFEWPKYTAPHPTIRENFFGVRWTGKVKAPATGTYTFTTNTDDGVRLYVDGKLLINNYEFKLHGPITRTATINLTGGQLYDIKMEYFEWYTTAIAKLLWKTPGSSSAVVIPTSNLFPPGAGATTPTPPPPPPSDTTRPTTSITAPAGGSTASGTVNVSANASDNVGVTKVEFLVDGAVKATDTTSSYGFAWDTKTVANGSHTLSAKAYDAAGNVGTSANVSVNVSNQTATAPPPAAPPPPPAAAVPVCQYFSKSLIAHYYHPSCADYSAYGFVNYGTAFYAYTSQVSGTVPVCNYYSTTDQGYAYTRGCADSYGTYKKIGTPFYAYQSAAAGRVGICGYYSSTNKDYAFTRGCAASYGTYNKIGDAPWWYGL